MMNNSSKPKPGPVSSKRQQEAEAILTKLCDNVNLEEFRDFLLLLRENATYGLLQDLEVRHKKRMLTNRFIDFVMDLILWQEEEKFQQFLMEATIERQGGES